LGGDVSRLGHFTGVVERIIPDGAHMQIVFVPLNDERKALVRDLFDRPRARIWEEYFEKGMQRPASNDTLGGFK
jgi:hypothetical protein